MKKVVSILVFLAISSVLLWAQEPLHFGRQAVYLDANVQTRTRTPKNSTLELGIPSGERLNVVVQFADRNAVRALNEVELELNEYIGSNAYFATLKPGTHPSALAKWGIRSIAKIRGEWKLADDLRDNKIPDYADEGERVALTLYWFPTVNWEWVKKKLKEKNIVYGTGADLFRSVPISIEKSAVAALADEEWTQFLTLKDAPKELVNFRGAPLHGGRLLSLPYAEGGAELTGRGVKVGVWDANVAPHVDYGDRVHCLEYEMSLAESDGHGMHVTGTIAGAGLLDEKAKGIAPLAEVWTSNFNRSSNGKIVPLEMYELWEKEHISLTNNSYGLTFRGICSSYNDLSYSTYSSELAIDILCGEVPTLTHVFAAGNEGIYCQSLGTVTHRAKNPIYVGNVDHLEKISASSSRGPSDDGRIYPTVSAKGMRVYSTIFDQSYRLLDGTSMACPTVTGHLALLTERFKQLNGGAIPTNDLLKALIANTARDEGRKGPDYEYGFGILSATEAMRAMDNKWYLRDEFQAGEAAKSYKLKVPAGQDLLRVMIVWNDPVTIKTYAHGEKALINDLDITVEADGVTYQPFVLDKDEPKSPATLGRNDVDPIEQIEIASPQEGEVTIKVNGDIKQGGKQSFVLTWYFAKNQAEFITPLPGDVYSPGDKVLLNVRNMLGRLNVELSADGGKTYRTIGDRTKRALFDIPKDFPLTNNAILRVTDESANVLTMLRPFTIMPRVDGVKLTEADCSTTGWKLTWNKAANIKSYNILKGNIKAGTYEKIGNTEAAEFDIPAEKVDLSYSIFAVQAVHADGYFGPRSNGVLATNALGKKLELANLPYRETFIGKPLKNVVLKEGNNIKIGQFDTPVELGLPAGSTIFKLQGLGDAKEWEKPFEKKDNVATFRICNLDLASLDKSKKLFLTVRGMLEHKKEPEHAQLRLCADGTPLKNVAGEDVYVSDRGLHNYVWDITSLVGRSTKLELQTALKVIDNNFWIYYYEISYGDEHVDLQILPVRRPEDNANLHEESFAFNVCNTTASTLSNIPVNILVDGKLYKSNLIENLKPYEEKVIEAQYDFSTSSPDGQRFQVEISTGVPNDINPDNDKLLWEIYNKGNVLLMPHSTETRTVFGIQVPVEKKETVEIDAPTRFTDYGGGLDNYSPKDFAALILKPKKQEPNGVLQVAFENFDISPRDTLFVWTNISTYTDMKKEADYKLSGRGAKTITSVNSGGVLAFRFICNNNNSRSGWSADVRQIVLADKWALSEVKEEKGSDDNHIKFKLKIENKLPVEQYNVGVTILMEGQKFTSKIAKLEKETKEYFLTEEFDVTPPVQANVKVELQQDGDITNNTASTSILRDPYRLNGTIEKSSTFYISKVQTLGEKAIPTYYTDKLYYRMGTKIKFYTASPNLLRFEFNETYTPKEEHFPVRLRLWIDLDKNDNQLKDEAPEYYTVEIPKPDPLAIPQGVQLPVDFTSHNVKPGEYRMRFAFFTDENWEKFKKGEQVPWGQIFDCTADIQSGKNPREHDLEILSFVGLESGTNLSNQQEVKLKVRNNGLLPVESFTMQVSINNNVWGNQLFTQKIEPYGDVAEIVFTQKADLSKAGAYRFDALLVDQDMNMDNNKLTHRVYHYPKKTDKNYSIHFVGDNQEWLQVIDMGGSQLKSSATIEGWWKLERPQSAPLLLSKNFKMLSVLNSAYAPDNTLYFEFGKYIAITKEQVLKPGEWQHIAIVLKLEATFLGDMLEVQCFINGESVELVEYGTGRYAFEYLVAARRFHGDMGMFRIWKKRRTGTELKENLDKSIRLADGKLPAGCILEYMFDEGESNCITSNNEHPGQIVTSRLNTTKDVWQPIGALVSTVRTEKAVTDAKKKENNLYELTVSGIEDWKKVKLNFVGLWPNTQFMKDGDTKPIDATTELDFSNAEHEVAFVAKRSQLFGKDYTENFRVRLIPDKSAACNLIRLSLLTADNATLAEDLVISNPEQTIILQPKTVAGKNFDLKHVSVTLDELSPNATFRYLGKVYTQGQKFTMDLSEPRVVKVVAENGRTSNSYVFTLSLPQTITWANEKITTNYSGTPIALNATASSGLPCMYYTRDKSVAVVNSKGEVVTTGVGNTEIVAMQLGNALYQPAPEVSRAIEVARIPLTISMRPARMLQGDVLPDWEFDYDALQFEGQGAVLAMPYGVKLADGSFWDPSKPALTPGEYEVVPIGYSAPYDFAGYHITRTNGKLTVLEQAVGQKISITVKDPSNNPIANATVACNEVNYKTDAQGAITFYLTEKGMYQLVASAPNYTTVARSFRLLETPITVDFVLAPLEVTITYKAKANGILQGIAVQKLPRGGDASQVIAVPLNGYRFVRWSDGSQDPIRSDRNVTADKTLEAEFDFARFTLKYVVTEGGEFESGTTTQQVQIGTSGTAVKVKARDGYVFAGWSDGNMDHERTDANVQADAEFTAIFEPLYPITYTENFDGDQISFVYWKNELNKDGQSWKLERRSKYATSDPKTGFVMGFGEGKNMTAPVELISPYISLAEITAPTTKVKLSFTYMVKAKKATFEESKVLYSVDNAAWTELTDLKDLAKGDHVQAHEITTSLLGKQHIRFKWSFKTPNTTYSKDMVAVDDVKVTYDTAPTEETYTLEYIAGEHGSIKVSGDATAYQHRILTASTSKPAPEVTATPDEGYEFESWSDSHATANRTDGAASISVTAKFKRIVKAKKTAIYLAAEHGTIEGEAYQSEVEIGTYTSPVLAVPEKGYMFDKWSDNKEDALRSDVMVDAGLQFTAQFVEQRTITYKVVGRGYIEGNEVQYLKNGKDGEQVEAIPADHYHFVRWEEDGSTNPIRKEVNVTKNLTFTAIFEPNTYNVELTSEGEGIIQVIGYKAEDLKKVVYGAQLKVTAIYEDPWQLLSIMANGRDITVSRTYVVNGPVNIHAIFQRKPGKHIVTLESTGEGSIAIEGYDAQMLQAVEKGTILKVVATPRNDDYELKTLTAGDEDIIQTKSFEVKADVMVKATFVKKENVAVDDAALDAIAVAPNPFNDKLNIMNGNTLGEYEILNAKGQTVRKGDLQLRETVILTTDFAAGVYIVRIVTENGATKALTAIKEQ